MYRYTADLLTLASRRAMSPPSVDGWSHIQCPMVEGEWDQCLSNHPDKAYSAYLLQGIREGFRIGYCYGMSTCRRTVTNMQSATVRPEVNTVCKITGGHRSMTNHFCILTVRGSVRTEKVTAHLILRLICMLL